MRSSIARFLTEVPIEHHARHIDCTINQVFRKSP
jgi:hypothetical protein